MKRVIKKTQAGKTKFYPQYSGKYFGITWWFNYKYVVDSEACIMSRISFKTIEEAQEFIK